MKTFYYVILGVILTLMTTCRQTGNSGNIEEAISFQKELNEQFADPEHSPLLTEDIETFEGLQFFPVNMKYRIMARFVLTPGETPFGMKTTTDRLPVYVKYGEAYFSLEGKKIKLDIFQNIKLVQKEG